MTLRNTSGIPDEVAWEAYKVKQAKPAKVYGGQCVTYAKRLLGQTGTWGNGGRNLSLNSGPAVNAVVVFKYTHVGVQLTPVMDGGFYYTDSNFDRRGTVRQAVWIAVDDPSIKGYHKF